ncbi:hypothetical protein DL98DRAFT_104788 [Cadophora sp. DSE1049]|nr:hypothetical protein DL98DRAFT_104788 [Cadophora sp. DSE1049]
MTVVFPNMCQLSRRWKCGTNCTAQSRGGEISTINSQTADTSMRLCHELSDDRGKGCREIDGGGVTGVSREIQVTSTMNSSKVPAPWEVSDG